LKLRKLIPPKYYFEPVGAGKAFVLKKICFWIFVFKYNGYMSGGKLTDHEFAHGAPFPTILEGDSESLKLTLQNIIWKRAYMIKYDKREHNKAKARKGFSVPPW
jgi:hypothetical protein